MSYLLDDTPIIAQSPSYCTNAALRYPKSVSCLAAPVMPSVSDTFQSDKSPIHAQSVSIMGYRTHFKWLDSHFISPTLKGCFIIFIPHDTSCGCGGGIWSQTKLPQALAFLLALGAYPHNRLMCRSGFPHLIPTNSAYCPVLCFNKIRLHIFAIFIARHCLLPRCLRWFRWIHQPSGGGSGI